MGWWIRPVRPLPPDNHACLLTRTNVPVGTHVLTAMAVDANGLSAVSVLEKVVLLSGALGAAALYTFH